MRRLKQLSATIKRWNKEHKKTGEEEHKAWITEIDSIDKLEEENNITNLHVLRRIAIRSDLNQKALREAQNWAQKCKGMCNMEGDENTTFFHKYMFNYTKKKLYN